jgi:hypothetical protein
VCKSMAVEKAACQSARSPWPSTCAAGNPHCRSDAIPRKPDGFHSLQRGTALLCRHHKATVALSLPASLVDGSVPGYSLYHTGARSNGNRQQARRSSFPSPICPLHVVSFPPLPPPSPFINGPQNLPFGLLSVLFPTLVQVQGGPGSYRSGWDGALQRAASRNRLSATPVSGGG